MSDHESRQAHFDSLHLKWENEDMIGHGTPSNVRAVLRRHPEHEARVVHDTTRSTP